MRVGRPGAVGIHLGMDVLNPAKSRRTTMRCIGLVCSISNSVTGAVLAVDAEPVAPGPAGGGRVRRGEQPVVGVGGREAGDHPVGHPGLVLGGRFGVGEPGRLGGGADGHTDAEHSGQPGGVEGELVGGAHGGQASS